MVALILSLCLHPSFAWGETLLSNIGEVNDKGTSIFRSNIWTTFKFTAGSAGTIDNVKVDLDETQGNYINFNTHTSGIVRFYNDSNGSVGTQVAGTLGYTSTNASNGHTIYSSGSVTLPSAGNFWIAFTCSNCANVYLQTTSSSNSSGVNNWATIIDGSSRTTSNNSGGTWGAPFSTATWGTAMIILSGESNANATPVMTAMNDNEVAEGATITITGTCTDGDVGDTLTITTTQTLGTSCGSIDGSPDAGNGGTVNSSSDCIAPSVNDDTNLVFRLTCGDGTVTNNDTVAVTVNAAPTATPQSTSTNEDTGKAIMLSGIDPSDEPLTYSLVTQPSHGILTGTLPNLTYTPSSNYTGNDSFTFKVNDGLQDSPAATIAVTVNPENDPPKIEDEEEDGSKDIDCSSGSNCALPRKSGTDPDGDNVTTRWRQIGGTSTLHFTDEDKVDLVNHRPMRGEYQIQFEVSDGETTVTSDSITITIPNNPPLIESDDDIDIPGASLSNSKYVLSQFIRNLDITSQFTDYDNDTLAYSWSLNITDPDQAGFLSTTSGASELLVRIAGDIIVTVEVDDGYGEVTTEEIVISIPVPEVIDDDMAITISSWTLSENGTIVIKGTLLSPIWPVIFLNGSTSAQVRLSATNMSLTQGLQSAEEDTDTVTYDTYSFTASDVPEGTDPNQLDIDVFANVNGSNVSLSNQTVSNDNGDTDLAGDDGMGNGDSAGSQINGSWGCSLIRQ